MMWSIYLLEGEFNISKLSGEATSVISALLNFFRTAANKGREHNISPSWLCWRTIKMFLILSGEIFPALMFRFFEIDFSSFSANSVILILQTERLLPLIYQGCVSVSQGLQSLGWLWQFLRPWKILPSKPMVFILRQENAMGWMWGVLPTLRANSFNVVAESSVCLSVG